MIGRLMRDCPDKSDCLSEMFRKFGIRTGTRSGQSGFLFGEGREIPGYGGQPGRTHRQIDIADGRTNP